MKIFILIVVTLFLVACTSTGHIGISGGSSGISGVRIGTGIR
ncbi:MULTISPECIES: hypothetical protein [Yersinia pseudotuberculosis complex]|nr:MULTISPECIES: hypothetical protein [Yersinia pseudotuberculosis complex]MDL0452405.1 hypothetical protein [Yersinia pestis]MDL0721410.1 hypothetical protein [Yersinia pestis]MDL1147903.1 hypothetical protein [Yersinia pestis]MDL1184442.1 hypothetical protein [Yersinia pestis]WLF05578.1 hypothetical protein Q6G25_09180 [Yersinia pseudotuberculosis]